MIAAALRAGVEQGLTPDSQRRRKLAEHPQGSTTCFTGIFQNKQALLDALAKAILAERRHHSLPEE